MFEEFSDISDWIDDQLRQMTREMDVKLLRTLGIEEDPEEVIIMLSQPDEDIVAFLRKDNLSLIKAMHRVTVASIADEIKKECSVKVGI